MSPRNAVEVELDKLKALAPAGYLLALHIRFAAPLVKFQTYRQDWIDHYTAQAYQLRDPMVAWGFTEEGATRWSTLGIPDPFGIMKEAADYGMPYGACVACGPIASRSICGFARADREFTDAEIADLQDIVHRLHALTEPPESLTQAQKDALRLIAAGDRHAAAAAKLGISESALKARLSSARQRLMARTTAEALQRAQEYRLL